MSDPDRPIGRDRASPSRARPRLATFSDLVPRVLSGVVMIGAALLTAILGGTWFAVFWGLAALAVFWEWQRLIGGPRVWMRVAVGMAALSLASLMIELHMAPWGVAITMLGIILVAMIADGTRRFLAGFGVLYAGALVLSLDVLRESAMFGLESILFLFSIVWATDIMAYFGGRLIGGPKLWPAVSPSKTWAGFLIGIGSGGLAGLAVAPSVGAPLAIVVIGVLTGAIAQGGDLFESSLKRRFGAKDSSRLIPGHGGVMDRLDGFLTAAACVAVLGIARCGVDAPGTGLFRW